MGINDTTNTLAWVAECRQRHANAIKNTSTGKWLAVALTIIGKQFNEIQDIRNADIDRTGELFLENERLRDDLATAFACYGKTNQILEKCLEYIKAQDDPAAVELLEEIGECERTGG